MNGSCAVRVPRSKSTSPSPNDSLNSSNQKTREEWLTELAKRLEPLYRGWSLGLYRLSCSWPSKRGLIGKGRVLGECHARESSKEGYHEIFITPLLSDSLEVAGTVCHELAHAAAGIPAGHGPDYVKVTNHIGLTKGKPTQAMPGKQLEEHLRKVLARHGPYPHSPFQPTLKKIIRKKAELSLHCEDCGCKVRISIKWLGEAGHPRCGCGGKMEVADE